MANYKSYIKQVILNIFV